MKKILNKIILLLMVAVQPLMSFAQTEIDASNIDTLLKTLAKFISLRILPFLILLALVYTVYAGVQYIAIDPDSNQKEEKKNHLISGIIGLFVIVSVWSLVALVSNTFDIFVGGTLRP